MNDFKDVTTRQGGLGAWADLFSSWGFYKSELSIRTLLQLWENKAKPTIIVEEFQRFVSFVEEEYVRVDEGFLKPGEKYRKKCFDFLQQLVIPTFRFQDAQWRSMFDVCYQFFKQEGLATRSWTYLVDFTTRTPAQSHLEMVNQISLEYANKVSGLYDQAIRIPYLWAKCIKKENISKINSKNPKIKNIQSYFKSNFANEILFEGYESHIRNAVAHSSYEFDKPKNKMIFRDDFTNWRGEFSHMNILQLSSKIMVVIFLIDILFGVCMVYDILFMPRNDSN